MNGGSVGLERCGPGWCGARKVPNWFLVLGQESYWLMKETGGSK